MPTAPLLLCLAAVAQTPPESPTIRVRTQLVQINAVVRDSDGPLRGLTKSDFTLVSKGRQREIATFSEDATAQPPPEPRFVPPARVFSNVVEIKRLQIILMDWMLCVIWRDGFSLVA